MTIHITIGGLLEVIGGAVLVGFIVWLLGVAWIVWRWDKH